MYRWISRSPLSMKGKITPMQSCPTKKSMFDRRIINNRSLHSATKLLKVLKHKRFQNLKRLSIGHISIGKATLRRLTT